jgi:hypothetical protein
MVIVEERYEYSDSELGVFGVIWCEISLRGKRGRMEVIVEDG